MTEGLCLEASLWLRTQNELARERAAALGRLAAELDVLLGRLADLARDLDGVPPGDREARLAAYRATREQARRYRWYLEVQREVLGLRRHDVLDEFYPIPAALD